MNQPQSGQGEIADKHLAQQIVLGHEPPLATVGAFLTVVTQAKVVPPIYVIARNWGIATPFHVSGSAGLNSGTSALFGAVALVV